MKQHKYYTYTVAAIFAIQLVFAFVFMSTIDGSSLQQKHIQILEAQNNTLNVQLSALTLNQDRGIASIKSSKELDLTEFYFSQIDQFKKEENNQAALNVIEKIQAGGANSNFMAKAEYEKINLICTQKLEPDCLREIDVMVSQFPDSNWTAKSLLLLSHYYYKQNRVAESKSLINIIRSEFKSYKDLNADIQKLVPKKL